MPGQTTVPFWDRVTKTDECWVWTGALSAGYGIVTRNYRQLKAHRLAYEEMVGPIPSGLEMDHLCRNRACVRPDHLEPVTHRENCRRGEAGKYWAQRRSA